MHVILWEGKEVESVHVYGVYNCVWIFKDLGVLGDSQRGRSHSGVTGSVQGLVCV